MTASSTRGRHPFRMARLRARFARLSERCAIIGGFTLLLVAVVTLGSAAGRTWLGHGISGDLELSELGAAFALFLFFPYCQQKRGHVAVSVLADRLRPKARRAVLAAGDLLMAALLAMLAWRLAVGGLDAYDYADVSMMLRLPLWWGYIPATLGMALAALISLGSAWARFA